MVEPLPEDFIADTLSGDEQKNALEFISYLKNNEMQFERGGGYWEDKYYLLVKYRDECVCFILVNDLENKDEPWIVWSDDSTVEWFQSISLDDHIKKIAWNHVDFLRKLRW